MINTKRIGRFSNSDNSHSSFDQMTSFYKDAGWTASLLDWDKPLFSQNGGSLESVLAHAKKTAERSRRFLDKIELKKQFSISRAKFIPRNATIRQEYVKCGEITLLSWKTRSVLLCLLERP